MSTSTPSLTDEDGVIETPRHTSPAKVLGREPPGSHVHLITDVVQQFVGREIRRDLRPWCVVARIGERSGWSWSYNYERSGVITCYNQFTKRPGGSVAVTPLFVVHYVPTGIANEAVEKYADIRAHVCPENEVIAFTSARACAIYLKKWAGIETPEMVSRKMDLSVKHLVERSKPCLFGETILAAEIEGSMKKHKWQQLHMALSSVAFSTVLAWVCSARPSKFAGDILRLLHYKLGTDNIHAIYPFQNFPCVPASSSCGVD
ncbi:unnamed protein product [Amoebophrya sp. A120]|nr:unnamed protein product [Amoebophrya sp. A120]|eukprot:GSA120T00025723001.1